MNDRPAEFALVTETGADTRPDTRADLSASVAILAPRGRDAAVAHHLLDKAGIPAIVVTGLSQLATLIDDCIGAVLMTEEALTGADDGALSQALTGQPAWSDVPFIVLANGAGRRRSDHAERRMDALRNAVLLSRPLHSEELIRSVRSALKARARQYEARERIRQLQMREKQLHDSEARYQAITDSIDQMIWSTRPDGYHDYYNDRWYQFTGMPIGSTDGEGWAGMFHPDDQATTWDRWRHSLETGEPYEVEYRLRHRSGEYRWVLGRAQPVRDTDGHITRWYGTCTDIHRIKIAEEQRKLMLGEMNHRVKNSLAMVHAVVSQTLRRADDLDTARTAIQARIGMMAQAHDRLVHANWAETHITGVIEAALAPHTAGVSANTSVSCGTSEGETRFHLDGPNLKIGAKQALALTMALHELATNALKYGALSTVSGVVHVRWQVGPDQAFHLNWTESGGPAVISPSRQGFGSQLIEQALAAYFDGTAELDFHPDGLRFDLRAAVTGLTRGE